MPPDATSPPPAPSPQPAAPVAIAIAVVEHDGRFLIGQRPAGVPLPGLWEFPGGKVEAGETPAEAAARECHEETGMQILVGAPYPNVVHQYDHGKVALHFFACRPAQPEQPPRSPFRWVDRADLANYAFPAANDALIRHLLQCPAT